MCCSVQVISRETRREDDDTTREMLHLLKFQGMAAMASSLLAPGIAEAMRKLEALMAPEPLVIPVPLFAARARSRG